MTYPKNGRCAGFFLSAGLAALLTSCGSKAQRPPGGGMMAMQVPIRAVPAVATEVPLVASAVGSVQPMVSVDVKSRVAGQIVRVDFQDGQEVRQGQVLFEIDAAPLEKQIAELEANIARDEALQAEAKANVAKDVAQQKQARTSADRALQLSKEGVFSREQTEQAVATADAAQASYESDQAAVQSALAATKADRARLAETQLQLSYTKVVAPISGRAGAIAVKAGNLVKDNDTTLVTILQLSPIYVSFALPEDKLGDIRKYNSQNPLGVQAVTADQQTEKGTVRFLDSSVDQNTGTITLKGEFANTHRTLWPGQFVTVNVTLSTEHGRILVPSRTVQTGPQGKYVWVVKPDDTATMQPVSVLRLYQPPQGTEMAVIGTGVTPGEMVVSEGQMRLMPGAKVRLLSQPAQGDAAAGAPAGGA